MRGGVLVLGDVGAVHLFIVSAPSPQRYFNPPHNSHLLNWIKQLLDAGQRGFIVHVCDPVV